MSQLSAWLQHLQLNAEQAYRQDSLTACPVAD
jgi:hypothetical protein